MALVLHANTTADGNGLAPFTTDGNGGEMATVVCWGNFGAGTMTVKMSPDAGTTWVDFSPVLSFMAAAAKAQVIPQGVRIRGELVGAITPAINLTVYGAD